ncbi:MAG: nicotinate (nicotinamide) nucleotide adenylyltransferase [Betaproteobacteria bacterium TMED82]|nr:MAG: nicotinate (nicotinamide) nucleotide adenylyltransferase [Betaproteobacteria bacterium TMED82]|tara:strand:+ start:7830 stop:8489 length:660 start_codon:yes stop_codon:yes gene_type:complete
MHKIGLFGGRFDPVHRAHLSVASAAADQLDLSHIKWIPTGIPVHKRASATADHRLQMLKIILEDLGDKRMKIDSREITNAKNGIPSYTYKTIQSMRAEFPESQFIWILGEDQLLNFRRWRRWQWLINNMDVALCCRPSVDFSLTSEEFLKEISEKSRNEQLILRGYGANITKIDMRPDFCSSTDIRKLLAKKKVPESVNKKVMEYISSNKLYQLFEEDC